MLSWRMVFARLFVATRIWYVSRKQSLLLIQNERFKIKNVLFGVIARSMGIMNPLSYDVDEAISWSTPLMGDHVVDENWNLQIVMFLLVMTGS